MPNMLLMIGILHFCELFKIPKLVPFCHKVPILVIVYVCFSVFSSVNHQLVNSAIEEAEPAGGSAVESEVAGGGG